MVKKNPIKNYENLCTYVVKKNLIKTMKTYVPMWLKKIL
jgi:hypothetical protein